MKKDILYKVVDKKLRGLRTVKMVLNTFEDGYYVFWNLYFNNNFSVQEHTNFKIFKTKRAAENFFNGCLETLDFLAR